MRNPSRTSQRHTPHHCVCVGVAQRLNRLQPPRHLRSCRRRLGIRLSRVRDLALRESGCEDKSSPSAQPPVQKKPCLDRRSGPLAPRTPPAPRCRSPLCLALADLVSPPGVSSTPGGCQRTLTIFNLGSGLGRYGPISPCEGRLGPMTSGSRWQRPQRPRSDFGAPPVPPLCMPWLWLPSDTQGAAPILQSARPLGCAAGVGKATVSVGP